MALVAGIAVSVRLFFNQALFVGLVPSIVPGVGDVRFLVGTVLSAAIYALLIPRLASKVGS